MLVGRRVEELDTPALLVDLAKFERNVETMRRVIVTQAGVRWRPHTKGIKVPALARKLLDAGARGVTCAKLGEAEVMAAAGITDILIANQVVGGEKMARLAELRRRADHDRGGGLGGAHRGAGRTRAVGRARRSGWSWR